MIFVTVGTQMPFDRLICAVAAWAQQNPCAEIVAQIGTGGAEFAGISCHRHLSHSHFMAMAKAADVIVAHAGMGSILTAAELGKPIIILPRRAHLGEHRNDHQRATALEIAALPNVYVAQDEGELAEILNDLLSTDAVLVPNLVTTAQPQLLAVLRNFIFQQAPDTGAISMAQVAL